jgi:hypothetical protein
MTLAESSLVAMYRPDEDQRIWSMDVVDEWEQTLRIAVPLSVS